MKKIGKNTVKKTAIAFSVVLSNVGSSLLLTNQGLQAYGASMDNGSFCEVGMSGEVKNEYLHHECDRCLGCSDAYESKYSKDKKVYNYRYWSKKLKNENEVLMSKRQIEELKNKTNENYNVKGRDLDLFDEVLSKEQLKNILEEYVTSELPKYTRYIGDRELDEAYYDKIIQNVNCDGIQETNTVRYGFASKNTHVRTFPTADVSYCAPNDFLIDLNCETGLKIWERALVLHTSKDEKYYFVKTDFYDGWVSCEDIALTDKETWQEYSSPEDFLVVTGDVLELNYNFYNPAISKAKLTMGTRLPLISGDEKPESLDDVSTAASYVVELPVRNEDGFLEISRVRVPFSKDVNEGYLEYTQKNILKQVFKTAGNVYGWSDLWDSRDCSSLVRDVYKTFGFHLPRNAGAQSKISISKNISSMSAEEKKEFLVKQPVGTLVYMPGHVVMYIGFEDGEPYIIHSTYKAKYKGGNEELNDVFYNSVVVSKLSDIYRRNGAAFLDVINIVSVFD